MPRSLNGARDRAGALDRPGWPIERREETVARRVHLSPAEALELRPHETVVSLDEVVPLAVAELDGLLRGADDVGEQHRREHAVDLRLLPRPLVPDAVQELPDRLDDLVRVDPGRVVFPGQLDHLRTGNALGQVAAVRRSRLPRRRGE